MARSFDQTKSQYLSAASAAATSMPITLSAWFYLTDGSDNREIITLGNTTDAQRFDLVCDNVPRFYVREAGATSQLSGDTSTNVSLNAWHHGCGVLASSTSRTAFLDGVAAAENTTSVASITTPTQTTIAARWAVGGSYTLFWAGMLCEIAVWNVALSTSEIRSLAKRVSPLLVRPQSLAAYWPLGGIWGYNDYDRWKRAYDLAPYPAAPNAPTWADHPPGIIYPPGLSI